MQWVASPTWPARLAVPPADDACLTICAPTASSFVPPSEADVLRQGRESSRLSGRLCLWQWRWSNSSNNEPRLEKSWALPACCNHFEGLPLCQCVLNGTAHTSALWPAILRRAAHRYLTDSTETQPLRGIRTKLLFCRGSACTPSESAAQRREVHAELRPPGVVERRLWKRCWKMQPCSVPTGVILYAACAGRIGTAGAGDQKGLPVRLKRPNLLRSTAATEPTPGCVLTTAQ